MVEVNGVSKMEDAVSMSNSHLGKRKRTTSPEPAIASKNTKSFPLQAVLKDALLLIRRHDTTPSLLKHPLPLSDTEGPETKRVRLAKIESAGETIEERVLAGVYKSFDELRKDVNVVGAAILGNLSSSGVNGNTALDTPSESGVREQLAKVMEVLSKCDVNTSKVASAITVKTEGEDLTKTLPVTQAPKHILSLRSHIALGKDSQPLFSGLELQPQDGDTDEPLLPYGINVTDFTSLGKEAPKPKPQKRAFSTVFQPSTRLKQLDPPRPASNRVVGSTTLEFAPYVDPNETNSQTKHHYKFTKLQTGKWLSYGSGNDHDKIRQPHILGAIDYRTALAANGVQKGSKSTEESLFSSVYSSFAPTMDNGGFLIPEQDRNRHWWHKYGKQDFSKIFSSGESGESAAETQPLEDDFADVVANFQPEEPEEDTKPIKESQGSDEMLEEVSGLIETLSSYQRNRTLDAKPAAPQPKPTDAEFDVFEMLRDQLKILISSLPPFAVAKLDGDQLEALNISTKLLVEPPDYQGTGQVDDYTWRLQMARQATSAPARTPGAQAIRPGYSQSQVTQPAYNAQARSYNASVPATAGYGARTANYQTPPVPRPTYSQTPVQATATPYTNRPTIQQFQRATQNGYANIGASATLAQSPGFAQRQSQPGYQPRVLDSTFATPGRSASPAKPVVNGQNYPSRQYPSQPQTPYAYQRQASGTPGTPNTPATTAAAAYGRYTATPDRASTEASTNPATAATAQTVEASR
ncbi:hypothetical protein LTR92_007860 [Exophiala xenobiotica]|nr:hypothetical protein LTR92_007860 [Exophiala xenobiotica]